MKDVADGKITDLKGEVDRLYGECFKRDKVITKQKEDYEDHLQ
jgi:hypothetical protein